ncbi:transglycosylase [Devosia pacifica]|uniref:Transglycosylase n=1 Tax=Devosia pacifica TaxID=1335967 RepID=A0A918S741_9HYPH|nr:lytic murein transglycosylase [Devosia pacifica]GHA26975.1 transglycosylase [Devosia pacifica]
MLRALVLAIAVMGSAALPTVAQPVESFDAFLVGFRSKAVAAGVSPETYQRAVAGLTPDPRTPALVTGQPEFATPIWDYIDGRVTANRISRGRAAISRNSSLFQQVGARYGVDPYLLGAIWGMETDYGAVLDNRTLVRPIIRSLATLVHQRRTRLAEDEADFIAALKLVERGPHTAETLVGSWAGAIGHLQVNPSNVLAHGTDGDGDGRVDLHASLADALATSAVYLRNLGYVPGVDWGFEVVLPEGFDYLLADRETMRPVGFFAERGVQRVAGRDFDRLEEPGFLYVPAGRNGPKFLMTRNYLVLKGYNFSDSYALSVAHMTDRLKGAGPFVQSWPRGTAFPDLAQRREIQQALTSLGYYSGTIDGRLGPISQAAYARFQAARGLVADGFITRASHAELLSAMR